jgi:hypothetical protein
MVVLLLIKDSFTNEKSYIYNREKDYFTIWECLENLDDGYFYSRERVVLLLRKDSFTMKQHLPGSSL